MRRLSLGLGLGSVLVGSLLVIACGGDGEQDRPDDDDTGGTGGTGATTGGAMPTGGTSGNAGGGASGSGTGGTGAGPSCVAPVTMCSAPCTPTTCEPVTPPQALITDFSNLENGQLFGAKDATGAYIPNWYEPGHFFGGIFAYPVMPDMCSEDMTVPTYPLVSDACSGAWRVTGTVGTYSGIGLWMETCIVDMSAYSGISFNIGGTVGATGQMKLSISTNGNLAPDTCKTNKGTCMLGDGCLAASTMITVPSSMSTVQVAFDSLTGGAPEAGVNAAEITGIQLEFDCTDCTTAPYEVNLTIDDITLTP